MSINLYFRVRPQPDKWIKGDRYIINFLRRLLKPRKIGGVEKVFINLRKGFDELNVDYTINLPFSKIKPGEPVVILGSGKYALEDYKQPNKIIAGIALMTHPADWPNLCMEYPIAKYLQHSKWTYDVYVPYYGAAVCDLWPSGIDTEEWTQDKSVKKKFDLIIYTKIMWNKQKTSEDLKAPIINRLIELGLTYIEITYGQYAEADYHTLLQQSKAMIFLCEHESQGFACCEALAMDIPVLAWDQGFWLDPERFKWETPVVPATSIPFFDDTCGMSFNDLDSFYNKIEPFWELVQKQKFHPRAYILKNLTLKKSAEMMLKLIDDVYN